MVKVLAIDDNPDVVFSIKKGLEALNAGYEITSATGGSEAIKVLQTFSPDIILLDIMMPDLNGWDVVAQIRDNPKWKDIPIIFLTAKDDDLSKGFAQLGVDDYIVKPIDIIEIDKRVKKMLS